MLFAQDKCGMTYEETVGTLVSELSNNNRQYFISKCCCLRLTLKKEPKVKSDDIRRLPAHDYL